MLVLVDVWAYEYSMGECVSITL